MTDDERSATLPTKFRAAETGRKDDDFAERDDGKVQFFFARPSLLRIAETKATDDQGRVLTDAVTARRQDKPSSSNGSSSSSSSSNQSQQVGGVAVSHDDWSSGRKTGNASIS